MERNSQLEGNTKLDPPEIKKGYFKLVGPNWELVIPQTTILLGRNPNGEEAVVDVHLSQNKYISRKHAKIRYNFTTDYFMVKCLSPNGLHLNDKLYRRHHGYQKLESKDKIQIGTVRIDFFLPFNSARKNEKRKQQREANSAKKRKKNPGDDEADKEKPPTKKKKLSAEPTAKVSPKSKGKKIALHPNPLMIATPQTTKEISQPPPQVVIQKSAPASLQERILQEMKNRLTEGT